MRPEILFLSNYVVSHKPPTDLLLEQFLTKTINIQFTIFYKRPKKYLITRPHQTTKPFYQKYIESNKIVLSEVSYPAEESV